MRIAMVVQEVHTRGGTERAMAKLAERLVARGHHVTFFATTRDPRVVSSAPWHHVPIVPRPSLVRFLTFLIMNTLIRAAAHWLRGERFDIVHATGPDVLRPTVTTLHCCAAAMALELGQASPGAGWQRWAGLRRWTNARTYQFIARLERFVVSMGATRTIVVSRILAAEVERSHGIDASRLTVIPNGVDLAEFHPSSRTDRRVVRGQLGVSEDQPVVLFVGYNWERKGLGTLVSALAAIEWSDRDLAPCLLVVGGHGRPGYEKHVTRQLEGKVRFLGTRDDVDRLYGAADICVLPSREEPFGLPIIEAMACGLPVIVSRGAGVAELISDGVDGVLLDNPADSAELATKLVDIMADPDRRLRMGERARRTAERYSWDGIAGRVEALYAEILATRAAAGRGHPLTVEP
jgi:UDP-glucose:(heptosyl)LPS alpha-1,3-glucosyltransferase